MEYSSIYQINPYETPDTLVKNLFPLWREDRSLVMAWQPDEHLLYKICRRYTLETDTETTTFEKIDLYTGVITEIELSGVVITNPYCMTYRGSGVFVLMANVEESGSSLVTLTTSGVATLLNPIGFTALSMCCIGTDLYILHNVEGLMIYAYEATTGQPNLDEYDQQIAWTLSPAAEGFSLVSEAYGLEDISDESNIMLECIMNLQVFDEESEESVYRQYRCQINLTDSSVSSIQSFGRLRYKAFCTSDNGYVAVSDDNGLHDGEIDLLETSLYNISEGPQFIMRFDHTEVITYGAIAWNRDNGYIYSIHKSIVDGDDDGYDYPQIRMVRYRANTEDPEVENISLTGSVYDPGETITTSSYIDDGGGDMYDDGNVIVTNYGIVDYTHTTSVTGDTGESFVQTADGAVADGSSRFGSGSEYFTNMYSKLFVMCASNVNVSKFAIDGELGADGGGTAIGSGSHAITVNDNPYTYYTKFVYGAGDPNVCHVIIVSGSDSGITHTYSENTDIDQDTLTGLGERSRLYYLLYSRQDEETPPSLSDANAIVQAFLEIVDPTANMTAALAALNSDVTNVTDLIPNPYIFTDYNGGSSSIQINTVSGITEPSAMAYVGKPNGNDPGYFLVFDVDFDQVFKLTANGEVSRLAFIDFDVEGAVYYKGVVYGVGDSPFLYMFDPKTGKTINESEDYKFTITLTLYNNVEPDMILVHNNQLCVMTYLNEDVEHEITEGYYLLSVDHKTGQCEIVQKLNSNNLDYLDVFGVGTNPPSMSEWFVSTETDFRIQFVGGAPAESDLEVQYFEGESFYNTSPKTSGWTTATFSIEENEESEGVLVVDLNPYSIEDLTIRVRYVGDESTPASAWWYTFWD
jgi:hypothetical protein